LDITAPERVTRIRELNDAFRKTFVGGVVTVTEGIQALPDDVKAEVLRRVREQTYFAKDDDPYGEHDFGAITILQSRYFWKIDYYDRSMNAGSEDPGDPALTTRVLTVMMASEY
jgi:hypothetical protein